MQIASTTTSSRRAAQLRPAAPPAQDAAIAPAASRPGSRCLRLESTRREMGKDKQVTLHLGALPPDVLGGKIGDFLPLAQRQAGLGLACKAVHAALAENSSDPVLRRVLQFAREAAEARACKCRLERVAQAATSASRLDTTAHFEQALAAATALAAVNVQLRGRDSQALKEDRNDLILVDRALRQLQVRAADLVKSSSHRSEPHEIQGAELLLHLGRSDEADAALLSVCFREYGFFHAVPMAAIALEVGREDLAAKLAEARIRPDDEQRLAATLLLALARHRQGQSKEALALLQAFQGQPHPQVPWFLFALVHQALGNGSASLRAAQMAQQHPCRLRGSLGAAGVVLMHVHLGNTERAIDLLLELVRTLGLLDRGIVAATRSPAVRKALQADPRGNDVLARIDWARGKADALEVKLWPHVAEEARHVLNGNVWSVLRISKERSKD